eukprot:COSAG03_NODE_1124_length_4767_cov_15.100257_6_plen_64_part_01
MTAKETEVERQTEGQERERERRTEWLTIGRQDVQPVTGKETKKQRQTQGAGTSHRGDTRGRRIC